MKILNKKAFKDLKNYGWRSILITLVLVLSLGGSLAFIYVILTANPWMESYFDNVNHADYTYQLDESSWMNQSQIDGLKNIDEIESYTGRLFWSTYLKLNGQNEIKYLLLVGLDDSIQWPKVYNYTITSGNNFDHQMNNLSIVVDKVFGEKNNLSVTNQIEVDGLNDANLTISGFFNSPEFISFTSSPEYSIPIKGSVAIIYLSKTTLKNYITDYFLDLNMTSPEDLTSYIYYYQNIDYNNIAVKFKDGVDKVIGNLAVKNYLENNCSLNIEKIETFLKSSAYEDFKDDIDSGTQFTTILLIFMLLMGVIITFVIFDRYIFSQKQQMGSILGFGYKKRDLDKYFLRIFFAISGISIPLSILLGYILGYMILGVLLSGIINLPLSSVNFLFKPEIIYLGIILGVTIILLSIIYPIQKVKSRNLSELIYGQSEDSKVKKIKKKIKAPKNPKKNVSKKLIYRNLFRNKKRTFFTTFAMVFSLLIISATQTLVDSMNYNVDRVFKSNTNINIQYSENWDLNVNFQNPVNIDFTNNTIDQISKITGISYYENYTKGIITAEGLENRTFLLLGFDMAYTVMHNIIWDTEQVSNSIPDNDNEIIIPYSQSLKLNKKVLDNITLFNSVNQKYKFTIVGVHKEMLSMGYVTFAAGQKLFHNNSNIVDGVYLQIKEGSDKEMVKEKIYDLDNIKIIFDAEEMAENLKEFFNDFFPLMNLVVYYCLIVSFFIVLYNSVMNIYDKNHEYGIMRSLGFPKKKIFKLILSENMAQGSIPIVIALAFTYPLGLLLAGIFSSGGAFEVIIGLTAISYIVIPPIVLTFFGSFLGLKTIYNTNLYEQVQMRFIG